MKYILIAIGLIFGGVYSSNANASVSNTGLGSEFAEELYFGVANPFKKQLNKIDPATGQKVDEVLIGPVYKAKRDAHFDFYRYVTFYDVTVRKERLYALPTHREQCFDLSEMFAGWDYTYAFTAKVNVGIQLEGLGLGAEMSDTHTFTTHRSIKATGRAVVDYTPYLYKQDWEGSTYLETVDTKTGKEELVLKQADGRKPAWVSILFPALAPKKYPMDFKVENADWAFVVEATQVAPCPKRSQSIF